MRKITRVIVHASATPPDMDIGVKEIREWHLERGWKDCGYHHVIRRNGELELGRPLNQAGAHAYGYNDDSIGVCLVGGVRGSERSPDANFTLPQYIALSKLIDELIESLGGLTVIGHRDLSWKACPCFDVAQLLRGI